MQFIPIVDRVTETAADGTVPWSSWRDRPLYVQEGDVVTGRSVGPEQYGRFLVDVFECDVRSACHGGCPKGCTCGQRTWKRCHGAYAARTTGSAA